MRKTIAKVGAVAAVAAGVSGVLGGGVALAGGSSQGGSGGSGGGSGSLFDMSRAVGGNSGAMCVSGFVGKVEQQVEDTLF